MNEDELCDALEDIIDDGIFRYQTGRAIADRALALIHQTTSEGGAA